MFGSIFNTAFKKAGWKTRRIFFEITIGTVMFKKGDMMKSVSASVCKVVFAVMLCALFFLFAGCSSRQMGETTAQGQIRHQRNLRINQQQMMADIDKAVLLDEPSRLTGKRIP